MRRALGVLFLFTLGCAPTPAPLASGWNVRAPDSGVGTLEVRLRDHLAWPYRLTGLTVVLDGSLIYRRLDAEQPFERDLLVTRLADLPLGEHTLALLAELSYPSGSLDDECELRLRTSRTFRLLGARNSVLLDAHAGDVTESFGRRVQVDVRVNGASPSSSYGPGTVRDELDPCG